MEIEVTNHTMIAESHERIVLIAGVRAVIKQLETEDSGDINPVVQKEIEGELNKWTREQLVTALGEILTQKVLGAMMPEVQKCLERGVDHIEYLKKGLAEMEKKHNKLGD